ncbi:MAG: cytochrome c biogenesis CcdA family protein [Candidatus Promineifilaceae bacterium]
MQNSLKGSIENSIRSLSTTQLVLIGLVVATIFVIIIGTIARPAAPEQSIFVDPIGDLPFPALAALAFIAGLLSFASPCTLPILPAYFAFAVQSGRRQIAINTLAFMVGLGTVFSVIGAGASLIGSVLRQNQLLIMIIGGAVILIFGVMSLLGRGFTGIQQDDERVNNGSLGSSYLFGMTFAVGWSSCIGPILGSVFTLTGFSGSIFRGMLAGFIYTLGLGLPLIIVSTFFGRASRKSLFWRVLRGRGWQISTPTLVVALIWALAAWRILSAVVQYAFNNISTFSGQEFTMVHEIGLLLIALAGAALWVFTSPSKNKKVQLLLHTTQLISGALFIFMGLLLLSGKLAQFNNIIPPDLATWFSGIEESLRDTWINLFS